MPDYIIMRNKSMPYSFRLSRNRTPSDMLSISADPRFCTSQFKASWPSNSLTGHQLFKRKKKMQSYFSLHPNPLEAQLFTLVKLVTVSFNYTAIAEPLLYLRAMLYWSMASWYSLTATRKSPRMRCRTQSL